MLISGDNNSSVDYVNLQNELINNNIDYRKTWEDDCKDVALAYEGNKFPATVVNRNTGESNGRIGKAKNKPVFLNLVKRQYRVIGNFLRNNEPQYVITEGSEEAEESDLKNVREALNTVFEGGTEDNEGFYDTIMDDTIFYGFHRSICWTMVYYVEGEGYKFKSYDPLDTYIDTDARRPSDARKFLITYTKDKEALKKKYPVDGHGKPIKWDDIGTEREQTDSNAKKCLLVEKPKPQTILVREGLYVEGEGEDAQLWKVITTRDLFLEKVMIPGMKFLPVTSFSPMGDPDKLYPRGWFVDMLPLEREINELFAKLANIVRTGGRYVYIRSGTKLTKGSGNLLNALGIEVIEVAETQELPKQAELLAISQADIQFLNMMMAQAEEEGGMKQDIMGTSSTGANASGRAIQALQAGSKNNIGIALNELNKYMTRITRILLRMFSVFGTEGLYSEAIGQDIQLKPNTHKLVKVKVSVTGRDAFDEVAKKMDAIDILGMIQKFNPNTQFPPSMITKIMGVTNDISDEIQEELDKQADPDLQIAEGENKKMMDGQAMNVNENDNHQIHMGLHGPLLQSLPPDSPAAQAVINHMKQHDAFMQVGMAPVAMQQAPMPQ